MRPVLSVSLMERARAEPLSQLSVELFSEPQRIARCLAPTIVIEIDEKRLTLAMSGGEPFGPGVQRTIVVATSVSDRTVKARVDERRCAAPTGGRARHIVNAARDSVLSEKGKDFVRIPARIAELDGLLLAGRQ